MRIIYADVYFLLNVFFDYLVLRCTLSLTGLAATRRRLLLACVGGGIYSIFVLLAGRQGIWTSPFISAAMVYITFGADRWFLRRWFLFYTVSFALAGLLLAMQEVFYRADSPAVVFVFAAALGYAALSVIFRGSASDGGDLLRAEFRLDERRIMLTLLHDTGNSLVDPLTGRRVCVLWSRAAAPLLAGKEIRYHRISFSALGTERGDLPCFYCDEIIVEGRHYYRCPVALYEHSVSDGRGFAGLWGEEGKGEHELASPLGPACV